MRRVVCFGCVVGVLTFALRLPAASSDPAKPATKSVSARVSSSLKTEKANIRQLAMDGDDKTCFISDKNPTKDDHFTLTLAEAVEIKSVKVQSGKPDGSDRLEAAELEWSTDGKEFKSAGKFADGVCEAKLEGKKVMALRIKPTEDAKHPLTIAEITIDSSPAITKFEYPVEFTLDVSDAPEMQEWGDKCVAVCEEQYRMINEQLKSPGYKPAKQVTMTIKNDYKGVAATGGNHITGAVKWFKEHPKDVGAMVHETVHVVQAYRGRGNPGWLVEGVADYVRFFQYEPGNLGPINAQRSHYNGSYRVTAAFLDYCLNKYDKDLVLKLNEAMRTGKYSEDMWEKLTGKKLEELDEESRTTLKK